MFKIFSRGEKCRQSTWDEYELTADSFSIRDAAKYVGTKPGATQFTRVSGAISAARA
jgi:hypothetical protein